MPEIPVVLWTGLDPSRRALELRDREHHHICRVLRLRVGAELELRDGEGLVARARLTRADKRGGRLEVVDWQRRENPAQPPLHLALPLLKGRRLDWVLEKATELGVSAFHLYVSRHSVVRREKAPARYAEIIAAAYCQSRRLLLPSLDGPRPFAALLDEAKAEGWRSYWGDENLSAAAGSGAEAPRAKRGEISLAWVGPEGGFSPDEREALAAAGAAALTLGPWRLRSETAALALSCRFLLPPAG